MSITFVFVRFINLNTGCVDKNDKCSTDYYKFCDDGTIGYHTKQLCPLSCGVCSVGKLLQDMGLIIVSSFFDLCCSRDQAAMH